MHQSTKAREKFHVEIIKPSHYDDDGYVIQWMRAFIPSNSLACLWALAEDAKRRQVLGEDVEIVLNGYDETHRIIPVRKIIRRMQAAGGKGIVLMTGVQSNQFPRAADLAREFRQAGIQVAIGGFHVSGCISMLPELPPEIQAVQDEGISLFAGEAEGRLEELFKDAHAGELKPVYNYLLDLPDLQGQITPYLPPHIAKGSFNFTAFDAGRGCPFRCSFCTIINVQGRKSRFRDADDVESIVRTYARKGVHRFFITDDNMARNKNWESIFDRLIELREKEGFKIRMLIQVDTQCHKIPGFIEKAVRAGVNRVFIGMESVNPENLAAAKKFQNNIREYRKMLLEWTRRRVLTHAGYILGFPADTPESIERDIRVIQEELSIDILEFFVMTPLPGSADHRDMYLRGEWMHPDMNRYDSEHVTTNHPRMTAEEWQGIYERAWHLYYSRDHVETLMRRAEASGIKAHRMMAAIMLYYGSFRFQHLHPLQSGLVRWKVRTSRRSTFPRENPFIFYPREVWNTLKTYVSAGLYALSLERICRRIQADPEAKAYTDTALTPVVDEPVAESECAEESATGCESGECSTGSGEPAVVTLTPLTASANSRGEEKQAA
ncbi:MAG: radical SAM protein [Planctomycetota bacterium]|nr:MAG: radical SAM protein [Planctomycetota bacterium]